MLAMPVEGHDLAQKQIELVRGHEPFEELPEIPVVEHIADIEDDGACAAPTRRRRDQPWRALKRRLVLLIT